MRVAEVSAPAHPGPHQTRPRTANRASPIPFPAEGHEALEVSGCRPGRCPPASPAVLGASCRPRRSPARALSDHPAWHPNTRSYGGAVDQSASAPPLALPRPRPLAPRPPAKHTTFRRGQTSDRQAHRQTHRHSPAATPRETASRRQLLSQSHGSRERPGPDEPTGGRLSGETEAERDRSFRDRLQDGEREMQTDRPTDTT